MGLFSFFKRDNEDNDKIVIPQPDENEIKWFFSDEAREVFEIMVLSNADEMEEIWGQEYGQLEMNGYITPKGNPLRREYPCTFFADYLRALKTIDSPRLAYYTMDLALDGDMAPAIQYPDCLKAEINPLINFAIKIKPVFYSKYGNDIQFSWAMNVITKYLHDLFANGFEDESNESWIYESSLWLNEKGKVREYQEIVEHIKANVKHKELLAK